MPFKTSASDVTSFVTRSCIILVGNMHTKHDSDTLHAVHRYLIGENRITWLLDWQLETGLCRVTREGKRGGDSSNLLLITRKE